MTIAISLNAPPRRTGLTNVQCDRPGPGYFKLVCTDAEVDAELFRLFVESQVYRVAVKSSGCGDARWFLSVVLSFAAIFFSCVRGMRSRPPMPLMRESCWRPGAWSAVNGATLAVLDVGTLDAGRDDSLFERR